MAAFRTRNSLKLLAVSVRLGTGRSMSSAATRTSDNVGKIISAALSSVSPPELVSKAVTFDALSGVLSVSGQKYHVDKNVKVVAFGKAVLGMVAALEALLGEHITGGVASIPVQAVEAARKFHPHHLPSPGSKIKLYEGAEGNLPDLASEMASREVLSVAGSCCKDDLLVALVSGGGSALLSCPAEGIAVEEKRKVIESLAKGGANIYELNTLRKAISQTKGGKLAQAAFPAKVLGLVLSDVIGDPLEVIASGPTVPQRRDDKMALKILDKYGLQEYSAVYRHLSSAKPREVVRDDDVFNVIIGSNKMATTSAKEAAIHLGYTSYVWTVRLEGEAAFLGELYALLSHHLLLQRCLADDEAQLGASRDQLYERLRQLSSQCPELEDDCLNLMRTVEVARGGPVCVIGSGEPTVRVTGDGKGGRNQELALAFAIKLHELRNGRSFGGEDCLFASIGTDGQDGPCDAAGAMVDPQVFAEALEQGLSPAESLLDNDSYTFFSALNSGKNLIKTGLTGTNVMDIHILLVK